MKNITWLPILLCCFLSGFIYHIGYSQQAEVGKPLAKWKNGELEIHHIYTGRGESTFIIMPDKTTLLIDVGDFDPDKTEYAYMTPMLPDSSKRAAERVADYIKSVNPKGKKIDYVLISHFHNDHMGGVQKGLGFTTDKDANYQISGITQLAELMEIGKLLDRDYPDYNFPQDLRKDPDIKNYMNFIAYQQKQGLPIEQFKIGSKTQIAMKNKPKKYPHFSILNLFNKGMVWNEADQKVDTLYFPSNQKSQATWNENTMSNGFVLRYGDFSYYTGGDLSGGFLNAKGELMDLEAEIGKRFGPIEISKANHHAYKDAMTAGFIKGMRSRYYLVQVWDLEHIQPEIIQRMSNQEWNQGKPDLIYTYFPATLKEKYKNESWMPQIKEDGHIVVKVPEGGKNYKIFVLDATNEKRNIKQILTK